MNLDRFCYYYLFATLPILILPKVLLYGGIGVAGIFLIFALYKRQFRYVFLAITVALSYAITLGKVLQADLVQVEKVNETIKIVQILKQQEYQTAIAQRENGLRIYLNWQSETPLYLDRFYQAELNIRPISSRLNDGNFDRQKWYFAQNIQQISTVRKAILLEQQSIPFRTAWLERAKMATSELDTQGLLLALAFGERAWLKQTHWDIFQQTSTAHLIAISGLHIALAMGIGVLFARIGQWFVCRLGICQAVRFNPFFAKSIGFGFAFGYSFLAGFAIPTVRALIAICLVLLCQVARRHYTSWQLWWRCVALLVLLDPMALLSDSFWLSILAVASLITWYQFFPMDKYLPAKWQAKGIGKFLTKSIRFICGLLHLQFGIWLIFSPVQLYFFDGIATFGLLANVIIVPLYSMVLVPLILVSLITDNLFYTWQFADWLANWSIILLEPLTSWVDLNYQQQWQLLSVNFLILALLYLWQFRQKWQKKWWIAPLIPLFFYTVKIIPNFWGKVSQVEWLNFDIGQGLAMALVYWEENQKKAILYDTGASWRGGSMAQLEIIPYLKREGIDVKAIFISHDDNDHAGGMGDILSAFPKTAFISPSNKRYNETVSTPCVKGQEWYFGPIQLKALYPIQRVERAKNEDSCVLLVTLGEYKLLFTGDSGVQQERQFVHQVGHIDFLQVGHHGSNTSTSQTLLANTQPKFAVISAGRWNPWRLPNLQVEKRLASYGVTSLNTAKAGMVKVSFDEQGYKINTARAKWNPWYQTYFGN
ncbi:DNA internalization-related competence protein ComEC/Rec2 [Ursidibacter sp. B-7004-1]